MTIAKTNAPIPIDKMQVNTAAITATTDGTTSVNSYTIDNRDGMVKTFMAELFCGANGTGTSPTLQLTLQGSIDGTNFFNILDNGGAAYQTSATSISSAGTTPVVLSLSTEKNPINNLPPFLQVNVALGGTSSPTATYTVATAVNRDKFSTIRN